ncbi:hypothetical protein GPECTOR_15g427 [Gonium pectorale]|uniref:Amine oxidase domain-containing protein n=1 Tax=Gonium pectorale TaxID=33097 RepID=A0A150GLU8_GONPE|nr:hypothetical protein GPECTOR_15g427 [Gonium pectorale]|eukprot:KXZ50742.1 hypothetical protein GPECTOR_15g427 [Gonium pectorale]
MRNEEVAGAELADGASRHADDSRGSGRRLMQSSTPIYDLVVIGSGMAGLAAARYAVDNGLENVVVVEGRERIGGRTFTVPLNISLPADAPAPAAIDLGAAWIHGVGNANTAPNPMVSLSTKAGLPVLKVTARDESFGPQGLPDSDAWDKAYTAMSEEFPDYLERYADGDVASMRPNDRDSVNNVLGRFVAERRPPLTQLQKDALIQYVQTEFVLEYADDLSQLSARYIYEDRNWGGPDALPGRGFSALVRHLSAGLDIRLRSKVDVLDYSFTRPEAQRRYVLVSGTNTSTGRPFTLAAKYVINTMPLGYLQAQLTKPAPNLFRPALRPAQSAAIMSFGMGLLQKVILVWPDASWWEELITTPWVAIRNPAQPGAFSEYYNLAATPAELPVLICFNGGSIARNVEASMNDSAIVSRALAPLQRLLAPSGRRLPPPAQALVTRWGADPWTRGAYSFIKAGARANARAAAFAPLAGGRLLFAGEHTHADYPSTVHGAYLSGLGAAEAVVDALADR